MTLMKSPLECQICVIPNTSLLHNLSCPKGNKFGCLRRPCLQVFVKIVTLIIHCDFFSHPHTKRESCSPTKWASHLLPISHSYLECQICVILNTSLLHNLSCPKGNKFGYQRRPCLQVFVKIVTLIIHCDFFSRPHTKSESCGPTKWASHLLAISHSCLDCLWAYCWSMDLK